MIDWNGKLEAVHTDGRVFPVRLDPEYPAPDNIGRYTLLELPVKNPVYTFRPNGVSLMASNWTIRNAPNSVAHTPALTEFGPEIKVYGVRPEWLKDEEFIPCSGTKPSGQGREWSKPYSSGELTWEVVEAIRLPANHPHYQTTPTRTPLEDRMVALCKALAGEMKSGVHYVTQIEPLRNEARAILAEMEPVDGDLLAARGIAADQCGGNPYMAEGDCDDDKLVKCALAAIKRGRQLEKEGK